MPIVVLLLSDKRSGSTMVQDELCRHADIRHVAYSSHTYYETHHWLKGAVMLGMACYRGYGSRANARAYLIDTILGNVPDFVIPDDDRELIFAGWEALCRRFARPVFFEKSPQFLAHPGCLALIREWIEQTAFDVRVIGLTRNPLSVLYSAEQLFFTDPRDRQFGWMAIQRNLLAFRGQLPEGQYLSVRYEDIISRPQAIFAEMCRFLGVAEDPDIGSHVHAHSVQKWRQDPGFDLVLDESVSAMAKAFGYKDAELSNPDKPGRSGWRKWKRHWYGRWVLARSRWHDRLIRPLRMRWGK